MASETPTAGFEVASGAGPSSYEIAAYEGDGLPITILVSWTS